MSVVAARFLSPNRETGDLRPRLGRRIVTKSSSVDSAFPLSRPSLNSENL
jgi:hypothetical protein